MGFAASPVSASMSAKSAFAAASAALRKEVSFVAVAITCARIVAQAERICAARFASCFAGSPFAAPKARASLTCARSAVACSAVRRSLRAG